MGLTNSVEEMDDSDIKITNEGEYNSWDDITKDLTDEKMFFNGIGRVVVKILQAKRV